MVPGRTRTDSPLAVVGGRLLTGLVDVTSDLAALDGDGVWAVVLPFEGDPVALGEELSDLGMAVEQLTTRALDLATVGDDPQPGTAAAKRSSHVPPRGIIATR